MCRPCLASAERCVGDRGPGRLWKWPSDLSACCLRLPAVGRRVGRAGWFGLRRRFGVGFGVGLSGWAGLAGLPWGARRAWLVVLGSARVVRWFRSAFPGCLVGVGGRRVRRRRVCPYRGRVRSRVGSSGRGGRRTAGPARRVGCGAFRPTGFGGPIRPAPVTALHRAGGVGPQQRGALRRGRPAAQVGDIEHVHAAGDDQFDDRLAEQLRAAETGTGPTPVISQSSSPATWPRRNASTSTRNSARYRGFTDRPRPRRTPAPAGHRPAAKIPGSAPAAVVGAGRTPGAAAHCRRGTQRRCRRAGRDGPRCRCGRLRCWRWACAPLLVGVLGGAFDALSAAIAVAAGPGGVRLRLAVAVPGGVFGQRASGRRRRRPRAVRTGPGGGPAGRSRRSTR